MEHKEQGLNKLESNIKKAADNLIIATVFLRSCHFKNASSLPSFTELRGEVTNDAKVYSTKILPFSIMVIENIRMFFNNYKAFDFEKFKEYIEDLANEADKNVEVCNYTVELHTSLLTDLKTSKNKALVVLGELSIETQRLEEKMNELKKRHKAASAWAISLAFVPYVNVIASPIVGYVAHNAKVDAIAAGEERFLSAAAKCIEESLIVSVEKFIEAITEIAGFFNVLATELKELREDFQGPPSKMHYDRSKSKGPAIVSSCDSFIKIIPTCKAELDSIEYEHDQNYVQQWLSKKQAENEGKSLADWGKDIFRYNKEILKVLTLEA